ncbi:MAG: 3-oxoacyl-ACP reductase FabG [Phycisphaerae bacterium]|nr:3-oxoacyl-ACP reductase FabG [Phycisphaerae bacterium]
MLELTGKVALVSGASRGIGRGIALVLAEKGADVCINYHSAADEAEQVANKVQTMGRRSLVIQADVSMEDDVRKMFEAIKAKFGRLDILVNNAGVSKAQDIFETDLGDWDFIIKTNLTSCFLCCHEAMKMMSGQGGRIVNISSVVAQQGALHGHVHYAATKSGILGMTKTLARTAAPLDIIVNAVAPGIIETELLTRTHGEDGVQKLSDGVPLGLGTPRDIGLAVAFLCGEGGRYITGTTINVNGGMRMD